MLFSHHLGSISWLLAAKFLKSESKIYVSAWSTMLLTERPVCWTRISAVLVSYHPGSCFIFRLTHSSAKDIYGTLHMMQNLLKSSFKSIPSDNDGLTRTYGKLDDLNFSIMSSRLKG